VIFPDLQPEESVAQFIDTLAYLSKATSSVFDRLAARVRDGGRDAVAAAADG